MSRDLLENSATLLPGNTESVVENPSGTLRVASRHNLVGWGFVALLLLVQFLLFRQCALREVTWSYPPFHDQLQYLGRAYDAYERILNHGLFGGLSEAAGFRHVDPPPPSDLLLIPPHPAADPNLPLSANGTFLHAQAAVLFFLIGPSRLSALSLCFIYLALFQCVVVATILWLTGRWSIAFIALGWLLSSPSQFDATGGIIDFRIDLTAMCLYGIFICLVIRSRVFSEWRWSALAGFCGAMLIGFRFIASVYLAAVMSLVMLFLLIELAWFFRKPVKRSAIIRQLVGAAIVCAIILLLASPLILHHYPAIHSYYIANHMAGQDRAIRARGQGIRDLWTSLRYYPESLYEFHAGPFFCKSAALLILFAIVAWLMSRRSISRRASAPIDFVSAAVFVACCLFVPFVLLSSDQDKTPVVADIMVGPFLWLIVLGVAYLVHAYRGAGIPRPIKWGLVVFASIILFVGMITQFMQYAQPTVMSRNRESIESLERLYDKIDDQCHDAGLTNPLIACDTLADYMAPGVFQVLNYERHGRLLSPVECMCSTIDAMTPDEMLGQLRIADFVLLSDHAPPFPGDFEYPFETSVRAAKPQLLAYCKENLIEQGRARLFDRDITLYARPVLTIDGVAADGWVVRDGITVSALAQFFRSRPVVRFSSEIFSGIPDRPVKVVAHLVSEGHEGPEVPGVFAVDTGGCSVTLTFNPADLPTSGTAHVRMSFLGAAVNPKLDAQDSRGLIMRAPTSTSWSRLSH